MGIKIRRYKSMDIVICDSLDDFSKVIKSDRITDDTIVVSLSCVIHPDKFPDKYVTYFYKRTC